MNRSLLLVGLLTLLVCLPSTSAQSRCYNCPTNCATCYFDELNQDLVITSASNGYAIDNYNDLCYRPCPTSTYYDYRDQNCYYCPNNCTSCQFVNNTFTVLTA